MENLRLSKRQRQVPDGGTDLALWKGTKGGPDVREGTMFQENRRQEAARVKSRSAGSEGGGLPQQIAVLAVGVSTLLVLLLL